MNDNEQILAELKKISAWADMQRKFTRWSLIFAAVFFPLMIMAALFMEKKATANFDELSTSVQKPQWYTVEENVGAGDFDKAIKIGEALILNTPQSPEAHRKLAGAYLAAGKINPAKEHYAEAFRLFPSEENGKLLAAIETRIRAESPQPSR